eukprot:scaffold54070_cov63-Phaeocystis_antarctica.AAC.1
MSRCSALKRSTAAVIVIAPPSSAFTRTSSHVSSSRVLLVPRAWLGGTALLAPLDCTAMLTMGDLWLDSISGSGSPSGRQAKAWVASSSSTRQPPSWVERPWHRSAAMASSGLPPSCTGTRRESTSGAVVRTVASEKLSSSSAAPATACSVGRWG